MTALADIWLDEPGDPDALPDYATSVLPAGWTDAGEGTSVQHGIGPSQSSVMAMAASATHKGTSSYSGLNAGDRAIARRIFVKGVEVLMAHTAPLHYSQDAALRWEGIHNKIVPWDKDGHLDGDYPHHGDCSSTGTYLMWLALAHHFKLDDHVNGQRWLAGYTGTLIGHGKPIHDLSSLKVGDAIIYGPSASNTEHVAWSLGGRRVFSHGGEAGPFILDFEYRPDRVGARRFI